MSLESYKSKLESLSATMESQQKLIHDTIGQQLALKKEFADKEVEYYNKIKELEQELKTKNSEISLLEAQLKEAKATVDTINSALLTNSIMNSAGLGHSAGLGQMMNNASALQQLQVAQQQVVQQQLQQDLQQQVVLQQMQVIESLITKSPPESSSPTNIVGSSHILDVTPPITPMAQKPGVIYPSPLSQELSQVVTQKEESEFMAALEDLSSSIIDKHYTESAEIGLGQDIQDLGQNSQDWTAEQDLILKKTVGLHGHDWNIVTAFVPEKSAQECAYRWKTVVGKKVNGRWYKTEDAALLYAYQEYVKDHGHIKKNSITAWSAIAEKIPGRTGPACMVRYNESLDPRMKRGKWNAEEDELLRSGFEIHGASWVKIAEMIPGRTQRQCRTRHLILQGNMKKGNILLEALKEPREPTQYFSGMDDSDVENYSESDMASDFGF